MIVVADLVRQVEEDIEVEELTKKFAGSTVREVSPGEDWNEETAIDIREEWSEEDTSAFDHRKLAHLELKSPKDVKYTPKDSPKSKPAPKPSSAVKDRIVVRQSTKLPIKDPLDAGVHRQAKESVFRQALRKSSYDGKGSNETLAPPK